LRHQANQLARGGIHPARWENVVGKGSANQRTVGQSLECERIEDLPRIDRASEPVGSDRVAELGSEGVTLENRELDTFVAPDPDEIVSETLEVRAYFPQPENSAALLTTIHQRLLELAPAFPGWEPQTPTFTVVRNEDWAEGWKQHFPVTRISRRPPPSVTISIRVAPASSAFSTSSLTTLAGRSTTSPAAMRLTTCSGSWRTGMGG
jgi:hypothetical protein